MPQQCGFFIFMQPPTKKPLNAGQQAASDGFFSFLFSDKKELILSGAGGCGKTYLMGYLINEIMPRYYDTCKLMDIKPQYHSVSMTATTNKAAEVLSEATNCPVTTIHSFLGLRVKEDFSTGKTQLTKTNNWKVHSQIILFIDECSMIDSALRQAILEGTCDTKIVYVGDHSQLPPVFEEVSPIYRDSLPFFELTEPMRNTGQPALQALCQQLRETVATGVFNPIQAVPGVIDWLDEAAVMNDVDAHFVTAAKDSRILAFSNAAVNSLNSFIRDRKKYPDHYVVGEHLISNSALQLGTVGISVEEPVEILSFRGAPEKIKLTKDISFEVQYMDLLCKFAGVIRDVPVPIDKDYFEDLVKYFAKQKDWVSYFNLKNKFPDLRPRDACTVHKSQGSSYETVFVDLTNLSTCHQPKLVARLLYVAASRASTRIVLYGNLSKKYGGVIE